MSQCDDSVPPASPALNPPSSGSATAPPPDTGTGDAPTSNSASVQPKVPTDTLEKKIDSLRESIVYRMPIVWDALPVKDNEKIKLFYGKPGDAHCLDLARPTEEQLCHLEEACDRATFGRNQEDVLDETYRKAGKMDKGDFLVDFLPPESFLGLVRDELLQRHDTRLVYDLYKLNVYGEQGFLFQAPQGYAARVQLLRNADRRFSAPHEGGELVFSDPKLRDWTVDAASDILPDGKPHLVCIAFYGDVMHEVLPVTSGHRVTITWNIFTENDFPDAGPTPLVVLNYDEESQEALSELLEDERLLPNGGYLGFGLRYEYPVGERSELKPHHLKGGDSMIWRICENLGLDASIVYLYGGDSHEDLWQELRKRDNAHFMLDYAVDMGPVEVENIMEEFSDAPVVRTAGTPRLFEYDDAEEEPEHEESEVVWVTEYEKKSSRVAEKFVAYGNEAYMDTIYATVAILVEIVRGKDDSSTSAASEET